MESLNYVEILGYLASVMVAISLMMKDIVKLRVLNFIGCALFSSYGVLIEAWPVAGMNAFIACINVYYLVKMYREGALKPAVA
ncbi:uroporphyrinogen decarboxylase [Shewanella sp. OPT22]|uniref:YgjV family protein n=1 Tax=Parashewanella hymeniacidonis TaxID=2807618 RepID=UPI00101FECD0|nr:YgjV family protein [Parashewanella hymeniacidonis]MBM7071191.1 YgjV family protein [Parashewanella hymeniacidonis]RYV03081.1 uroporphyrinogen decarboxylase [Shewanella sp. OPT22]